MARNPLPGMFPRQSGVRLRNIALTGTICVGKSTLAKDFAYRHPEYAVLADIPLLVSGERGSFAHTQKINNLMKSVLLELGSPVIMDRYFTDRIAWELMVPPAKRFSDLAVDMIRALFVDTSTIVCYLPRTFTMTSEHRRDREDRTHELRSAFDLSIQRVLETFGVFTHMITGSRTERVELLEGILSEECIV